MFNRKRKELKEKSGKILDITNNWIRNSCIHDQIYSRINQILNSKLKDYEIIISDNSFSARNLRKKDSFSLNFIRYNDGYPVKFVIKDVIFDGRSETETIVNFFNESDIELTVKRNEKTVMFETGEICSTVMEDTNKVYQNYQLIYEQQSKNEMGRRNNVNYWSSLMKTTYICKNREAYIQKIKTTNQISNNKKQYVYYMKSDWCDEMPFNDLDVKRKLFMWSSGYITVTDFLEGIEKFKADYKNDNKKLIFRKDYI